MRPPLTTIAAALALAFGLAWGPWVPAVADDARPLGETAVRLPRARLATSLEGSHSCAALADGTVRCWGFNASGQLGNGATSSSPTPVQVSGLNTAIAVVTGRDHSCALVVDGTVRCWGANASGQLGNGTTTGSRVPVPVSGLANVVSINAGSLHTCARLSDGTVRCWGGNSAGQLGDNTRTRRTLPVQAQGLVDVRAVAAGANHTCALRAGGTVQCWGDNAVGQLGLGNTTRRLVPTEVGGLDGVHVIAAGTRFTCAVRGTGDVRCWGDNQSGQFGNGTTTSSSSPVPGALRPPPFTNTHLVSITTGGGHTCSGDTCWGQNASGQLGLGSFGAPQLNPGPALGALSSAPVVSNNVVETVAGLDRTCALLPDDTIQCWGENGLGQLGNGSTTDAAAPTVVAAIAGSISARGVAAGLNHSCAWRSDGTASCWGFNAFGQIGDGTFTDRRAPVPVIDVTGTMAIVAGESHTCANKVGIRCWGLNRDGQVRPGDPGDSVPTATSPVTTRAINLAAGAHHTILVRAADEVDDATLGWGANDASQLGNLPGFTADFTVAGPLANAVQIVAGFRHSCALKANGTVHCWGSNQFGQLGTGSISPGPFATPQQVQGVTDAVGLAAGASHNCAVLVGGTVRCWGVNDSRQLGDGTTTTRRIPVTVTGLTTGEAVAVAVGGTYSCMLRVDGTVRCWGGNSRGELGDTTTTDSSSPVIVQQSTRLNNVTLAGVVALVAGNTHACAVRVNGGPVCWGNNAQGQIGDGGTTNRTAATGVPSFVANIDPHAALDDDGRHVEVTTLVNCPETARFKADVELTQGVAFGYGEVRGECTGGLERVLVRVSTQSRLALAAGAAQASAVVDVRDGRHGEIVVDHQEWSRQVELKLSH